MEVFTLSIDTIKKKVEELSDLQKNGKPGYSCGWIDACGLILAMLDKEEIDTKEQLKARIAESAIKVSTVKAPHTYMKAVGTRELEKILEEEFKHGTK
ncbi:hypothetical protein [Moryella indoligenes]|uniref:hypothetical protein n=1 Tax=Moryella indoligenes TaxID=371674 RepID=UPI0027D83D3E|nr:hypothetical protein [Moryella indoligenes]